MANITDHDGTLLWSGTQAADKGPAVTIPKAEYDRLVPIAHKAVALANAQNKLESAVILT